MTETIASFAVSGAISVVLELVKGEKELDPVPVRRAWESVFKVALLLVDTSTVIDV